MIDLIFYFGTDIIFVRVDGANIQFSTSDYASRLATIDGLKLSHAGVLKEFPDLKDNPNWNLEAIARFKEKIRDMQNEEEIAKYLIEDLRKFGYVPRWKQKAGFRRVAIK